MISLADAARREAQYLVQTYDRYPLVLASGEGCYVFDTAGRRYLDAITGIGVSALGHAHPRIVAALTDQARLLIHSSNIVYNPYQGELAERLCRISGMDRVFFSSTGTEAMEAALKAVRGYARTRGAGRTRLVALRRSFHGRTIGSLAVTGQPAYQAPFGPLTPDVVFIDPNDVDALSSTVDDDTAAVVLEPILGEGGIIVLEEEFLCAARAVTNDVGALLVLDEIQCGLGRTGRHFAYQWANASDRWRPDIVVAAKPLAAGYPLAATLFTDAVAAALPKGSHGTTFGGGPLACRLALEFLSVLDDLLPQVRATGTYLVEQLRPLRQRHHIITEVRGKGLMLGLELAGPARPVVERALERGLLVNSTHGTVLRLLPPFTLSRTQADDVVRILDEALTAVGCEASAQGPPTGSR
jgi:predicted acetylornithine/succinylornithine family transaminase